MNERIKKLRKALDLTQREFAERIGMKSNTIATYEMGRAIPSDPAINNICKEFGVNEAWLRTGDGTMFAPTPTSALDLLAEEQHLTHGDYVFIEKLLKMKRVDRQAVMEFMLEFAKDILNSDVPIDVPAISTGTTVETSAKLPQKMSDAELHAELDRQLAEEKKRAENQSAYGHGKSGTVVG